MQDLERNIHILGSHQLPEEPEEFTLLALKALGEGEGDRRELNLFPAPRLCQVPGSLWTSVPQRPAADPSKAQSPIRGEVPVLEPELGVAGPPEVCDQWPETCCVRQGGWLQEASGLP